MEKEEVHSKRLSMKRTRRDLAGAIFAEENGGLRAAAVFVVTCKVTKGEVSSLVKSRFQKCKK